MGDSIRIERKFVSGLLLLTLVWLVGCATTTERTTPSSEAAAPTESVKTVSEETPPGVVETVVVETATVEVIETVPVEEEIPTACPDPLWPGEACVPYEETPPTGDAKLVPFYAPMRAGLETMNSGVREELLDTYGLKINTARTVVLSETVVLEEGVFRYAPEPYLAANSQLVTIRVSGTSPYLSGQDPAPLSAPTYHEGSARPGAGQDGNAQGDCAASSIYTTMKDNEDNALSGSPDGDMGSWRLCMHRNDAAHPIEFNIDVPSIPPGFSAAWLSLTTWDVDEQDLCPEQDAVYFNGEFVDYLTGAHDTLSTSGPYFIEPGWVQAGHNLVEIQVNTDGCLSSDGSERWCVAITEGSLRLEGSSCAPAVETVAIAPIITSGGDPDELLESPDGVVLDMLVLETNVPESHVDSGAYLERARPDGEEGYIVELISTENGETAYVVTEAVTETNSYEVFSAQIDLGTKWCRTCLRRWCVSRPCFFWE